MSATSVSSTPKTPLDYMAESYWQEFLAARPIAGGMAYEPQLHDCQLDESLASLQRIDTLITQIRRDIAKAGVSDEASILGDERYRHLLLFLAFYAGRVLARQWQTPPHWYGQFELRGDYPDLPLIAVDFYHHMAVSYRPISDTTMPNNRYGESVAPVFFALEVLGMRLFGHIDRQFQAVQGGQVASGLYQAVSARLPSTANVASHSTGVDMSKNAITQADIKLPIKMVTPKASPLSNIDETVDLVAASIYQPVDSVLQAPINATAVITLIPAAINSEKIILAKASTDNNNTAAIPAVQIITAPASSSLLETLPPLPVTSVPLPMPEIFAQLLTELESVEMMQSAGSNDYQQACKILDQFERHIAKQKVVRTHVMFSESHQAARQQALIMLKSAATLGHTAAMLRLAMYELLGEGLAKDKDAGKEAGVAWVKQAASERDIRAQRFLSRLYYQGVGVPQDIDNGKYWLEQAAKNGHADAAMVVAQWQQAQVLMTTQKQEHNSIKRYQLLIGVVVVAALLLIIFV